MKIHITDEYGQIIDTKNIVHSVVLELADGSSFEIDGENFSEKKLQIWAGRRPWVAASKDVMSREQWKAFIIEPGAANVIRLSLRD
ncbi:hypothetical protein [Enterobacter chuandaensis]|uniref:hypothetical protein n=1 Tax=Enterobacter chuandaensis TaxID=2497875 RepID=UPI00300CAB48